MKYSELKKLLIQNGAVFEKHGKKHDFWRSRKNTLIVVPRHGSEEVPQGTLNDILNKARN